MLGVGGEQKNSIAKKKKKERDGWSEDAINQIVCICHLANIFKAIEQ